MEDNNIVEQNTFSQLMTGTQVARILNIYRSQAFRLIQQGHIPAVHFGRNVRVKPEDLWEFIKNGEHHDNPDLISGI